MGLFLFLNSFYIIAGIMVFLTNNVEYCLIRGLMMKEVPLTSEQLLNIIFSYTAKISSATNINDILMLMADMGKEMIQADRCTIWLISEEKQELYTTIAHGTEQITIPLNTGVVGNAISRGEAIIIEDAYKDDRHFVEHDLLTGYRTRSMITVPFRNHDNQIIGAYQAINKLTGNKRFTTSDLEYLTLAASYSGKSLEAFMLRQEIIDTQRDIISAMGEISELRSRETANHVKRVAAYSYVLALGIGLNEEQADLLRMASPMHDIGKIAIPDHILNKPGKLTDDEYRFMQTHTSIGHQLLVSSKRELMHTAAIVALQHHEKWDGTGYPHGLRGEEIHIFGRITSVADVFDALSTERVYKTEWSIDNIKQFFYEQRGKHFDPAIVDVFFEVIPQLLEIRQDLMDHGTNRQHRIE